MINHWVEVIACGLSHSLLSWAWFRDNSFCSMVSIRSNYKSLLIVFNVILFLRRDRVVPIIICFIWSNGSSCLKRLGNPIPNISISTFRSWLYDWWSKANRCSKILECQTVIELDHEAVQIGRYLMMVRASLFDLCFSYVFTIEIISNRKIKY